MKRIQFVDGIEQFWPLVENRAYMMPEAPANYVPTVGYHLYADLRLKLEVAAAENSREAMECVNILEDYTAICDQCASLAGAKVLEVQGERIHFFLPAPIVEPKNLATLVGFAASLTRVLDSELRPRTGGNWRGFSTAAAHGQTVLVTSTFGGGSVVSLGNAANQPAKRLGKGVNDDHLALPEGLGSMVPGAKKVGDWYEINVLKPVIPTKEYFNDTLTESMRRVATDVAGKRRNAQVREFQSEWAEGKNLGKAPYRTRGMCLRADLDGFTKKVESAFAKGRPAVEALVRQFIELMEYPREFAKQLNRDVIELPWAGDCATVFIRPRVPETVEAMRAVLPIQGGRIWHGIAKEESLSIVWQDGLKDTLWVVGFACGDADEGGNGGAIIAEFTASNRPFRVVVGWCSRRAKDAQEADGTGGDDVVIPAVDWDNIEQPLRSLFSELVSAPSYKKTTYAKIKQSTGGISQILAVSTPTYAKGVTTAVPASRPYWLED
jgi:hypothetical protein